MRLNHGGTHGPSDDNYRQPSNNDDFPVLRSRTSGQAAAVMENISIADITAWAQSLLDDLNKAAPADRLKVIIAHAMPLTLVSAMLNQNASTP